jgi:hypothetical protein
VPLTGKSRAVLRQFSASVKFRCLLSGG